MLRSDTRSITATVELLIPHLNHYDTRSSQVGERVEPPLERPRPPAPPAGPEGKHVDALLDQPEEALAEAVPAAVVDEDVDGAVDDDEEVGDGGQDGHQERGVEAALLLAVLVVQVHAVALGEDLVELDAGREQGCLCGG